MPADTHTLGDAPIQADLRETLHDLGLGLDEILNDDKKGRDRTIGFVLLVFPFGTAGRANYISNGADHHDIVTLLKEQIARFEAEPVQAERG